MMRLSRAVRSRTRWLTAGLGLALFVAISACSSSSGASTTTSGTSGGSGQAAAQPRQLVKLVTAKPELLALKAFPTWESVTLLLREYRCPACLAQREGSATFAKPPPAGVESRCSSF